jgi:hypothetical protein
MMPKKDNQNKKQGRAVTDQKTGFGDKKLEGPNRPAD